MFFFFLLQINLCFSDSFVLVSPLVENRCSGNWGVLRSDLRYFQELWVWLHPLLSVQRLKQWTAKVKRDRTSSDERGRAPPAIAPRFSPGRFEQGWGLESGDWPDGSSDRSRRQGEEDVTLLHLLSSLPPPPHPHPHPHPPSPPSFS